MKFTLHTYGCQMNVRDSELVTALLLAQGHTVAATESEAELIIVNTCSVRGKAEDKALGKLGLLCATKRERPARIVGVMGCMAQRLGEELFTRIPRLDFAVGTRRAGAIPHLLQRVLRGETNLLECAEPDEVPSALDAHTASGISAYVTILLGCNRRCSYCIVPDVRGPEYSRPGREILTEIELLARDGIREVTLLGQSVMNYGRTNPVWQPHDPRSPAGFNEPFARLLEAVAAIDGIKRIRFTSGHPSGVSAELARAFATIPQLCHHLHLPLQSGSDRVLRAMRRGYTVKDYLAAAAKLRAIAPDFPLTTDIIVGFPGESAAEFEATREVMQQVAFDNAFIFKYSPRPGTPAAALDDDVPTALKEERNHILLSEQDMRGRTINSALSGSLQEVLVEGPSLRNRARWCGRSSGNKIVIFDPDPGVGAGDLLKVRITAATPQTLYGEIVR